MLIFAVSAMLMGTAVGASAGPVTVRVSVDTAGRNSNGDSRLSSISASGRYVAFESYASDLVPGDGNGFVDVWSIRAELPDAS